MLNVILILAIAAKIKSSSTITPLKLSTSDTEIDPTNDVIFVNNTAMTWDYATIHSELDINNMTRSGQNFTISFYENITIDIYYSYALGIYKTWGDSVNFTVNFMSEKGYFYNIDMYHWNGTGWSLGYGDAKSVGVISGNTIEISIPTQALIVDNSWNWYCQGVYQEIGFAYVDGCPNEIVNLMLEDYIGPPGPPEPPGVIYGFELSTIVGTIIISIFGLIYLLKKRIH